eukprot:s1695_g2.t1
MAVMVNMIRDDTSGDVTCRNEDTDKHDDTVLAVAITMTTVSMLLCFDVAYVQHRHIGRKRDSQPVSGAEKSKVPLWCSGRASWGKFQASLVRTLTNCWAVGGGVALFRMHHGPRFALLGCRFDAFILT